MALDYKKLIETNQKVMVEYDKIDAKRRTLRIILSRLSEIEFVRTKKEVTPAIPPEVSNGLVTKEGTPGKYEIVHELPNDRSLGQTTQSCSGIFGSSFFGGSGVGALGASIVDVIK